MLCLFSSQKSPHHMLRRKTGELFRLSISDIDHHSLIFQITEIRSLTVTRPCGGSDNVTRRLCTTLHLIVSHDSSLALFQNMSFYLSPSSNPQPVTANGCPALTSSVGHYFFPTVANVLPIRGFLMVFSLILMSCSILSPY